MPKMEAELGRYAVVSSVAAMPPNVFAKYRHVAVVRRKHLGVVHQIAERGVVERILWRANNLHAGGDKHANSAYNRAVAEAKVKMREFWMAEA